MLNQDTYRDVEQWIETNLPTNRAGKKTVCFTNESNGLLNRFNYPGQESFYVNFLDKLDQKRNTNWRKTFPLAVKLLDLKPG